MLLDLLDVQHDYQSVDLSNNVQQLDPGAVRPEVSEFFECFCKLNVSSNELPDQLIDRPQLSSSPGEFLDAEQQWLGYRRLKPSA